MVASWHPQHVTSPTGLSFVSSHHDTFSTVRIPIGTKPQRRHVSNWSCIPKVFTQPVPLVPLGDARAGRWMWCSLPHSVLQRLPCWIAFPVTLLAVRESLLESLHCGPEHSLPWQPSRPLCWYDALSQGSGYLTRTPRDLAAARAALVRSEISCRS